MIYFALPDRFENGDPSNDRGGLAGGRLETGFDPTFKGFFHGGDLKGLAARLDYIQSLGATALWLTPVFKNKPVQGGPGDESAGYHGYWITDFTRVDPHLGDEAQMRALVDAAHARGMKVYMDIIANHTADVIAYRECPTQACDTVPARSIRIRAAAASMANRSTTVSPVTTRSIKRRRTLPSSRAPTTRTRRSCPERERNVKVPAWLNDPIYYHNRGNTTFEGESSEMGDFVGLDDLMTENPRVVQGFIDIYADWIDRYGVDGFRIDTARHVNVEFWQAFSAAMRQRAAARGIPNFHIFGEVATSKVDTALLARYTNVAKLPAVLDFAFANAVRATRRGERGHGRAGPLVRRRCALRGRRDGSATAHVHQQSRSGSVRSLRARRAADRERGGSAQASRAGARHAVDVARRADCLLRRRAGVRGRRWRSGCATGHVQEPGRELSRRSTRRSAGGPPELR